jgi:hypothetical protein
MRNGASQEIREEQREEGGFVLERPDHRLFVNAHESGVFHGGRGRHTNSLSARQVSPQKAPRSKIATTASLPSWDTTESLTWPFWIEKTASALF